MNTVVVPVHWADLQPTQGGPIAAGNAIDAAIYQARQLNSQQRGLGMTIKLRVFAGLTLSEAVEILGLSTSTADRHWVYARAWLRVEIAGCDAPGPGPNP